jgi:hypothetical protein
MGALLTLNEESGHRYLQCVDVLTGQACLGNAASCEMRGGAGFQTVHM